MDERAELQKRLRAASLKKDAIDDATAEGRLGSLAVELALGGTGQHSLSEVARAGRLSPAFTRALMQAIGRPNPGPRERLYTHEDIEMVKLVRRLLDAGLPRNEFLEVARVISEGMARTSDAVRRLAGDALLRPGDSEYTVALRYVAAADQLAPLVPELLNHQFRAHLRDGIRRELITESERKEGRIAGTEEVTVAFADLVDYTRVGERMPPEDVGRIAGRLAELAVAAVCRPARLIKTIGDAAMFVSPDVPALLETITSLIEAARAEGAHFPRLRVGIAYGPAASRGGDWFGATVNVASRITDVAKPDQVLATEEAREHAPQASWKRKRRRNLKGVEGRVRLYELVESG